MRTLGLAALLSVAMAGTDAPNRRIWLAALNEDPSDSVPSADGRYLAFTDWSTGGLGVRDLVDGKSRRLIHPDLGDYAWTSAVSPDNRQVAYGWYAQKGHEMKHEVRIVSIFGGAPHTVHSCPRTEHMRISGWSPDGKRLLVVRSLPDHSSQLAFVSIQNGSVTALKSFSAPDLNARLSPDGKFIAYDFDKEISVMAANGSRDPAVVQRVGMGVMPVWSADGSRILFAREGTELWSVDIENGLPNSGPRRIKTYMDSLRPLGVTRAGTFQYLSGEPANFNIYSAPLDRDLKISQAPVMIADRFANFNKNPSLSPDGEELAYYSLRRGETMLVIRTLSSGEERELRPPAGIEAPFGYGPMWFPDGESVLVFAESGFYRVNLRTRVAELLHPVSGLQGYHLSPDGKAIFYTEHTAASSAFTRLVRFDLDSGRETVLKTGAWFIAVAVSPDSCELAYFVSAEGGDAYIALMPTSGGKSRELFRASGWIDGSRYNPLSWSPDQKFILFARDSGLWKVAASGAVPERIGSFGPYGIKSAQVHPDGKRIFFSTTEMRRREVWAVENPSAGLAPEEGCGSGSG